MKRFVAALVSALMVVFGWPGSLLADTPSSEWYDLSLHGRPAGEAAWQYGNPSPQGQGLFDVAYGHGRYVAVGGRGALLVRDGAGPWRTSPGWTRASLFAVAFGADTFVAVGHGGTVLTSADGSSWVERKSGTEAPLLDVLYADGSFVAVGSTGEVITSADGIDWWSQTVERPTYLAAVAYGNGRLVAVGHGGEVRTTGGDGTWKRIPPVVGATLHGVTFDGKRFLAVGNKGAVAASADGQNWQVLRAPAADSFDTLTGVAFANGRYIASGLYSLQTSTDGVQWQTLDHFEDGLYRVRHTGREFVAVGRSGQLRTSVDGMTWRNDGTANLSTVNDSVAYGAGRFVSVGPDGIFASEDGAQWRQVYQDDWALLNEVVYTDQGFVVLASHLSGGNMLTSPDGLTWKVSLLPFSIGAMASGDGHTVAVGDDVMVTTGPGAWRWGNAPADTLSTLAYGAGRFVAGGREGLYTSMEGGTWYRALSGPSFTAAAIAFGDGKFVAVGLAGETAVSTDGNHWEIGQIEGMERVNHVAFGGGRFLAVGDEGQMAVSEDGTAWQVSAPVTAWLRGSAYGEGRWVAVGLHGAIIYTDDPSAAPCQSSFNDIDGHHPACAPVAALAAVGAAAGYPDGTFRLNQTVTRAEFAKLLVTTMQLEPDRGAIPFADARGHWSARQGYLKPLLDRGLLRGFPDGTFRPDEPLTRAQAVRILNDAAGLEFNRRLAPYADLATGSWYERPVQNAVLGQVIGRGAAHPLWTGLVFRPEEPVTRAEAAMLLANLLAVR